MKNRFFVLAWIFIALFTFCGCASTGKPIAMRNPANIKMNPSIEVEVSSIIKKVFVGGFKNATNYAGADAIFANAIKSKLMDRGFELVENKTDADLYFEGAVYRCKYDTSIVGLVRSVGRQMAYGKQGREHTASLSAEVTIGSGEKTMQTKISGETKTFEQDIASGINDISLKIADKLVGTIKKARR